MKPNIILLTVDSLRSDHLGCYGYGRPTSPHIDALAAQGVLCERVFCSGLPTQPSYTTLYTGQHPLTHGIVNHYGKVDLPSGSPFLPELFQGAGYTTCGIDNLWSRKGWFGRGYEYYIDPSVHQPLKITVTCDALNARAIPWIRDHADEPFFLLLHYWDVHYPYVPPAEYRKLFYEGDPTDPSKHSLESAWDHPIGALARETWLRTPKGEVTDLDYAIALYDQELRYLDDGIGELVAALDELGLAEQTLVVVLGDHGESLGEHGIFFEHYGLYDCTLQIPVIARWPGRLAEAVRVRPKLQHQDIAPTLLQAAGLQIPEAMDGASFWPLLTGEQSGGGRERLFSLECSWQAGWSLRTDDFKMILSREPDASVAPKRELYDLVGDPEERHNIANERPQVATAMENDLEQWIAERLRALGKSTDPLVEQGISLGDVLAGDA